MSEKENKEEKVKNTDSNETSNAYEPKDVIETTYEPNPIEVSNETATNSTKKKKSFKLALIIILSVCIFVGIIIAIYFLFFSIETIDLEKYIKAEFEGYDGYGTASVKLDSSLKDEFKDSSVYKKFKKKAELEITSDNYDLKNGDTIKVKIDISNSWLEKNRLKIKDKTINIKVSDLPEADTIDVFEDLEITVDGVSPNLSVSVNNNNPDEFIRTIYYYLSDSYGLENGDTITITASYSEYDAQEMGVIVAEDTMEYTIEDQPYYANKKDDITENVITALSEDMIEEVKDNIDSAKSSVYNKNSETYNPTSYYSDDLIASEPELVNIYLLSSKNPDSYYYYENCIYNIYKVTYTSQETNATFDWYFASYTTDVAVTADGKLYEDDYGYYFYSNYSDGDTIENLYDEYIDSQKSDYIIETIK